MTLAAAVARIPAVWPEGADFRTAAAMVAAEGFGPRAVSEMDVLVNIGALALAMGSAPIIHELRPEAVALVEATDLRSAPSQPPGILRSACVIEAGGSVLFGETTDLGIYQIPDGRYGLVGFTGRDGTGGAVFALWRPHWAPEDVEDPELTPALVDETEGVSAWAREAIRFLLVYGLLLEADKTPILTAEARRRPKRSVEERERIKGRGPWTVRCVSLSARAVRPSGSAFGEGVAREGLILAPAQVSGHLRRQAVGPGRRERQWIYVEGYEARRWIAPGPRKIIVKE